jgi:hypothetical protein
MTGAKTINPLGHAAALLEDIRQFWAKNLGQEASFSEEKELFSRSLGVASSSERAVPTALPDGIKVFWFFFSKKNNFPSSFDEREIGEAVHGIANA